MAAAQRETMSLSSILILYLCFRAKQLICDYFLQTAWIATVKGVPDNPEGGKALALHAGIHGVFTLMLVLVFAPALWWLGPLDFIIHGLIDKLRSMITARTKWGYNDTFFWWLMGIDQEAHNLTHLAYIIMIVLHSSGSL